MTIGETHLQTLLKDMTPVLDPAIYVFVHSKDASPFAKLNPLLLFKEEEGTTAICEQSQAEAHGLPSQYPCRRITLMIHSSLEAVGLMATITSALASRGISVNPVSGYFHDHLFIKQSQAAEALAALETLSKPSPL